MGEGGKFKFTLPFFTELRGIDNDYYKGKGLKLPEYFGNRVEIEVDDNAINKDKIEKSKEIFQLENKYSNLKDEMRDLYFKHKCSSESQMKELKNGFPELNLTETEIKEIYYGVKVNKEEYHKRPLSKFIGDLIGKINSINLSPPHVECSYYI